MKVKLTEWKIDDYLKTPKQCANYLEAAVEEGDPLFFVQAVCDVARVMGKKEIAAMMSAILVGANAVSTHAHSNSERMSV